MIFARQNGKSMTIALWRMEKIYKIKSGTTFKYLLQDENLELIWEKKELKKMTVEEIKQKLEELIGERIEVI